ncbi:MAG: phosphonate metabolism protein/1,5-bisphosphokinase (PRPP-forming) PhnN [Desulfobulbaceae bacterium]|nr:MAG: phosphonate metabolism protein/1,5-bisphosphokinase (PRPP-forming) PhnN [Desulfobulbaceae bacterium]
MKLLLIVGPSGAGKDSLLRGAREHFKNHPAFAFIRRYITRPPDDNEDNYYIDDHGFALLEKSNFFLSTWRAHGNCYGVSRQALNGDSRDVAIASISRTAIEDFQNQDFEATTLLITAAPEILQQRLAGRGRESIEQIKARLQRSQQQLPIHNYITFDNSAPLHTSISKFNALLLSFCPHSHSIS